MKLISCSFELYKLNAKWWNMHNYVIDFRISRRSTCTCFQAMSMQWLVNTSSFKRDHKKLNIVVDYDRLTQFLVISDFFTLSYLKLSWELWTMQCWRQKWQRGEKREEGGLMHIFLGSRERAFHVHLCLSLPLFPSFCFPLNIHTAQWMKLKCIFILYHTTESCSHI